MCFDVRVEYIEWGVVHLTHINVTHHCTQYLAPLYRTRVYYNDSNIKNLASLFFGGQIPNPNTVVQ